MNCGLSAVDPHSGRVVAFWEFLTAVEEIFDVQLLPGLRFPEVLGVTVRRDRRTSGMEAVPEVSWADLLLLGRKSSEM